MGKLTFILGGARSGKSNFAQEIAYKYGDNVAYVATCPYYDEEMQERIKKHKEDRPSSWDTFEEFNDLEKTFREINQNEKYKFVLVDCMTLFTSTLLLEDGLEEAQIKERVENALKFAKSANFDTAIVSNEVGQGIIPEHAISRTYRDISGRVNQLAAKYADEAYFVVAGIPMKLK